MKKISAFVGIVSLLFIPLLAFGQDVTSLSQEQMHALLPFILINSAIGMMLGIAIYLYSGFALYTIAEKLGAESPWMAFVPFANIYLITQLAGVHWWPMLLLLAFPIPLVNIVCFIIFAVYSFGWMWRIFVKMGRPGWWVLFGLIPFFGSFILLILLGIVAWKSSPKMPEITLPPITENTPPPESGLLK